MESPPVSSANVRYGKQDEFMSRQKHEEFRCVTTVLAATEGYEISPFNWVTFTPIANSSFPSSIKWSKAQSSILTNKALKEGPAAWLTYLNYLNQLFVREHEILALATTRKSSSITAHIVAGDNQVEYDPGSAWVLLNLIISEILTDIVLAQFLSRTPLETQFQSPRVTGSASQPWQPNSSKQNR